ncbi:MAG: Na(+)/H(+) antiporter subunit D, partial [Pseudomonadota bacterium]
ISHMISQWQILVLPLIVWILLNRAGAWVVTKPGTVLDFDWVLRSVITPMLMFVARFVSVCMEEARDGARWTLDKVTQSLTYLYGPDGPAARLQPTGSMVLWLAIILAVALSLSLIDVR